jgi:sodium-dependent dicarboxylate transporter 2/3/5
MSQGGEQTPVIAPEAPGIEPSAEPRDAEPVPEPGDTEPSPEAPETGDAEPGPEPPGESPWNRWLWIAIAVAVATLGYGLAPAPWPDGAGRLEVTAGAEQMVEEVRVGDTAAVEIARAALTITFPGGIPTRRPVEARVQVTREGQVVNPGLDAVSLTLVLADGRRERIPLVRWDDKTEHLVAQRRPPVHANLALALLGLVVILWVTETLPLFVTALIIPVVLAVAGAQSAEQALAPFFHPIIALFFGSFLMAEAMRRAGLDHLAAVALVARAGSTPVTLLAALMGMAAFLSLWMSNTAATALMVPIALAMTAPLAHAGYRKVAVLGLAYAATIAGVGSAVGTPGNALAMEFLDTFVGRRITFLEWFGFGLPMVVLFLPIMGAYLWWRMGARVDPDRFQEVRRVARDELARLGRPTGAQWMVLGVFALAIVAWLTQGWHGAHSGIIAVSAAVLLVILGRLDRHDLGRISWPALLTFGGGLALGSFLVESGTSDWLATRLGALATVPPAVGVAAMAALTLGLTAVASNTAAAAMLIPLTLPLASVLGGDPVQFVIVVAIASSVDFALVIGTPPTMIAYATELFDTREIFRVGIVLDLIGIALLVTAVSWVWQLLGLMG